MLRGTTIAAVLGLCTPVSAGTCDWIGVHSDDWHRSENWNGGVPAAGDNVYLSGGVFLGPMQYPTHPTVLGAAGTCQSLHMYFGYDMEVSGDGNLTVGSGVNVLNGSLLEVRGTSARVTAGSFQVGGAYLGAGTGAGNLVARNGAIVTAGEVVLANSGDLGLYGTGTLRGTLETGLLAGNAGFIQIDGGRIRATADNPAFITGAYSLGSILIGDGNAYIDTNGHDVGATAYITGGGGLVKEGAGELKLLYDLEPGLTSVKAGTLTVDGVQLSHASGGLSVSSDTGIASKFALRSGATATVANAILAGGSGVGSDAIVSDAGTTCTVGSSLIIGTTGLATMEIRRDAVVQAGSAAIAAFEGSNGTLLLESGGRLVVPGITKGAGTALVTLDSGVLEVSSNSTSYFSGFSQGEVTMETGGGTIDTGVNTVGLDLVLDGPGGLTKTGTGILQVRASTAFDGVFAVDAGRVSVSDSGVRIGGAGGIVVNSGGVFGGSGTVAGDAIVRAGGTLEVATLTVEGNLELLGSTSFLLASLQDSTSYNTDLQIGGDLLAGGALHFLCADDAIPTTGPFSLTLMGTAGTVRGHFDSVDLRGFPGTGTVTMSRTGSVWHAMTETGLFRFDETSGVFSFVSAVLDADGDGLTDLIEHAFNLDPTTPELEYLPVAAPGAGPLSGLPSVASEDRPEGPVLIIRYLRRRDAEQPGFAARPEFSDDPGGTWTTVTGPETVVGIDTTWEHVTVEDAVRGAERRFGRIRLATP